MNTFIFGMVKIMANRAEKKLSWIFRLSSTGRLVLCVSLRQSLKGVKFLEQFEPWFKPEDAFSWKIQYHEKSLIPRIFKNPWLGFPVPDKPQVQFKLTSFFRVQNKKEKLPSKKHLITIFSYFFTLKIGKNPPSHFSTPVLSSSTYVAYLSNRGWLN